MRRTFFGVFCLILLVGFWMYFDRPSFLYPALPFSHADKQLVVAKLKHADEDMLVPLGRDVGTSYFWLGAKAAQNGDASSLKALMQKAGWTFLQQEGAGYFFEKDSEKIVITSQMWSREFVLFKVPSSVPAQTFH